MYTIHSDIEFHVFVGIAVNKAINEVVDKIFKELQQSIQRDIYNAYSPQDYDRTGELLDAWERQTRGLIASIEFKPEWLSLNPTNWQHGSVYGGNYTDIRNVIFDILEQGYGAYNYHKGKPIPSRPMWNEFIAKVDSKFDRWMRVALRRQGLVVI